MIVPTSVAPKITSAVRRETSPAPQVNSSVRKASSVPRTIQVRKVGSMKLSPRDADLSGFPSVVAPVVNHGR